MSYTVNLSPPAKEELWHYIEGGLEFGDDIPETILDAFGNCVSILQDSPKAGSGNLPYLLPKYRALQLWKHYWLIYQVIEKQSLVNIEYVVDDRQNYVSFVK